MVPHVYLLDYKYRGIPKYGPPAVGCVYHPNTVAVNLNAMPKCSSKTDGIFPRMSLCSSFPCCLIVWETCGTHTLYVTGGRKRNRLYYVLCSLLVLGLIASPWWLLDYRVSCKYFVTTLISSTLFLEYAFSRNAIETSRRFKLIV